MVICSYGKAIIDSQEGLLGNWVNKRELEFLYIFVMHVPHINIQSQVGHYV